MKSSLQKNQSKSWTRKGPPVDDRAMLMTLRTLLTLGLTLGFSTPCRAQTADLASIEDQIYQEVDRSRLLTHLKEMTGVLPMAVNGSTVFLTDRYTAKSKANFREYWKAYFRGLGIDVQEFAYPTAHREIEAQGHNLEAVLPGKSKDSVVFIVHYDSMGPSGHETQNPGVDDDMTGMSTLLETARLLSLHRDQLRYTVRFVASDFEEWGGPGLEGARKYAAYLKKLSTDQNFKLIAAIDDEQSGWNCAREGKCRGGTRTPTMLINDCATNGAYASKAMSAAFIALAKRHSSMPVVTECAGQDSDHYAMWEIGMPAIEYGEFSWQNNDHFDDSGGDVYSKIDEDYYVSIARLGVTFSTTVAGLDP